MLQNREHHEDVSQEDSSGSCPTLQSWLAWQGRNSYNVSTASNLGQTWATSLFDLLCYTCRDHRPATWCTWRTPTSNLCRRRGRLIAVSQRDLGRGYTRSSRELQMSAVFFQGEYLLEQTPSPELCVLLMTWMFHFHQNWTLLISSFFLIPLYLYQYWASKIYPLKYVTELAINFELLLLPGLLYTTDCNVYSELTIL